MKRRYLVVALLSLITILVIAVIIKDNKITAQKLIANKDLFTAIKDLATIIAIILGVIFTYYRYFIGKTFSLNGNIDIDVTLIETENNTILHCLKISFKNIGTLAIWQPRAKIYVSKYEQEVFTNIAEMEIESQFSSTIDKKKYDTVIDSGETAYFFAHKEFLTKVPVVSYKVEVTSANKKQWHNSTTVKNAVKGNGT